MCIYVYSRCCKVMASSRPRREVFARSPSQSDMEDIGSDSDYSPGSLMIDMGNDGIYNGPVCMY